MITITIRTENAAFQDEQHRAEVARILEELARRVRSFTALGRVYDSNGNTVGEVKLTGKDRRL